MQKKSRTVSNSEQEHRSRPLSYTHLQQNAAYVVIQIVEFLVKLSSKALTEQKGLKCLLGCMHLLIPAFRQTSLHHLNSYSLLKHKMLQLKKMEHPNKHYGPSCFVRALTLLFILHNHLDGLKEKSSD